MSCLIAACESPRLEQRCRFGAERLVVKGGGSLIRSVSLARRGDKLLAAWTDRSGTQVVLLDQEGQRQGKIHRIGPPTDSVDVVATDGGFVVAMLRPGHLVWGGGAALVVELSPLGQPLHPPRELGRAGSYSRGISVVKRVGGSTIAWGDGTPGALSVKLSNGEGEPRILSAAGLNGCCPHLVEDGREAIALWGQYGVEDEGSRILMQRLDDQGLPTGPQISLANPTVVEPWPVAELDEEGFGLVYRDRRLMDTRDQLVYGRFDRRGQLVAGPVRLGRYDGRCRSVLMRSGRTWASLAVRTWSQQWILGFDRFDRDGERIGAELHVFDIRVRFTDADAVRVGDRYLVLYAEDEPLQRLFFSDIRCW